MKQTKTDISNINLYAGFIVFLPYNPIHKFILQVILDYFFYNSDRKAISEPTVSMAEKCFLSSVLF